MAVLVGKKAPVFNTDAVINGNQIVENFSLEQYLGKKYVLFFFYPADFTFVCPTELGELADNYDEFKEILDQKGGFVLAHWDGTVETEVMIKDETKATIRLIPMNSEPEKGKCIYSGKPSKQRVVFAKAY